MRLRGAARRRQERSAARRERSAARRIASARGSGARRSGRTILESRAKAARASSAVWSSGPGALREVAATVRESKAEFESTRAVW